jgi:hypothetical protein
MDQPAQAVVQAPGRALVQGRLLRCYRDQALSCRLSSRLSSRLDLISARRGRQEISPRVLTPAAATRLSSFDRGSASGGGAGWAPDARIRATGGYQINAGGPAVAPFTADEDFTDRAVLAGLLDQSALYGVLAEIEAYRGGLGRANHHDPVTPPHLPGGKA